MVDFNSVYQGDAPWDISRPQKEFVQLEKAGEIVGSVLEVGSGTGENALFLEAQGHEVWGVDFSPNAIKRARDKATERNLNVTFLMLDALDLHTLGRTFDTIIDSGLFHVLSDEERSRFVASLASVLCRHGTYFMLCFSELEPGSYGPRRLRRLRSGTRSATHGTSITFDRRIWKVDDCQTASTRGSRPSRRSDGLAIANKGGPEARAVNE